MTGLDQGVSPWVLLLAAAVGYGVGAINPAAILARLRGVDLHEQGSGNPGATNAARVLGRRTGVVVGVLDILKGFVPAFLFGQLGPLAGELAGLMAVLGHVTSPFLGGRGGKGVATTLGALLGVEPLWTPFVLAGFAVGFAVSRRVGIGAVVGCVVLIGCGVVADEPYSTFFGVSLGLVVLVRHRRNIAAAWLDWRGRGEADDGAR